MTTSQLTLDWLDALLILRRVTEAQDVRGIFERTTVQYMLKPSHRLLDTEHFGGMTVLSLPSSIDTLPRIERVEILTYTACVAWWLERYPGNPACETPREAFEQLCQRAGCWHQNNPDIRERWRLIDFKSAAHLLPSAQFEDRPKCRLCGSPVATGAGSIRHIETGLAADVTYQQYIALDTISKMHCGMSYRPDLHEECDRYIHRVMIPMRKAQVEAEKALAAGEVDK